MTCHNVFNVWPKTTLLPVWHRDAKRFFLRGTCLKEQSTETESRDTGKLSDSVSQVGNDCAPLHLGRF